VVRVDGSTRVYAVIGHPVEHSLSPRMQNAAFEAAGRNAVYVAFDTAPSEFPRVLDGLHRAGVDGLNVTLPHKEEASRLCIALTDAARAAGAANTLRREAEGWHGDATDGVGFQRWVSELGISIAGTHVLLLGAGGAALSIAPRLARMNAGRICIVSRNSGRAQGLVARLRLSGVAGVELSARPLEDLAAAKREGPFDLLTRAVSAESVGEAEAAWWSMLKPDAAVLDLNYAERAREVRGRCARDGRRFEDGLGLLLHQGARSYEYWTREPAPLEAMRAALAGS
jgi:shikimate dehydrogenase